VADIIRNYRSNTNLPICVYPNSGEIYDGIKKIWKGAPDGRTYGERAKDWLDAGANWIGGCCRTSPRDIKAVAELRDGASV
jgi:homocysteine S-methyltransferase